MVNIVAQTREEPALLYRFERHQRQMGNQLIAIVKLNFADLLMRGKRRGQLFAIQAIAGLNIA